MGWVGGPVLVSFLATTAQRGDTDSEDMEFAGALKRQIRFIWAKQIASTHLPHKAVYITLTMISVGSLTLGIGRSSMATTWGSLKTTAFIVSLAIAFPVLVYLLLLFLG